MLNAIAIVRRKITTAIILLCGVMFDMTLTEAYGQGQWNGSLPNFDDVVTVQEPVLVYRDYSRNNRFYIVPQAPLVSGEWELSLMYRRSNRRLAGNAVVDGNALISPEVRAAVEEELQALTPNPELIVLQPSHSEYRVKLFGDEQTVTDRFVVNPIGERVSISFELNDLAVRSLLHETSYLVEVGIITFKFAIRGVELDQAFQPALTRRWFNIHSVIDGNCLSNPERFLNVGSGEIGCAFKLRVRGRDIRTVQAHLRDKGYYAKAVDGVIGPYTRDAVRAFQEDNDLLVDGLVSMRLLDFIAAQEQRGEEQSGTADGVEVIADAPAP